MKYIICFDKTAAAYYKAVKGFKDSECILIATNSQNPIAEYVDPGNVYFVPGWHRGKYVKNKEKEIKKALEKK